MAQQGRVTPVADQVRIAKLIREGHTPSQVSRILFVSRPTVYKYADALLFERRAIKARRP